MDYRSFGRTGLTVSVFTLGGMRFLHVWDQPAEVLPDASLDNAHQVIVAALEAGCNLIETAQGYPKSEGLIGHVLPHVPAALRDSCHLMGKGSPTDTPGAMRDNLERTLRRLGVDRLELFAVHGINTEADHQKTFGKQGCLAALEQARSEGLIGHLGFSSHAPLPLMLRTLSSGAFDFFNLHYYYFQSGNGPAVALAAALGMGILIISPNDKGGTLYQPPERLQRLTAPLHPVNLNERWLLAHPEIHTLSIGLSDPSHMAIHLQSLASQPWWGAEERAADERLQAAVRGSGLERCRVQCQRCLPCPEQIDIPELMRLLKLATSYDMVAFGRYRYGNMQPGNRWVPGAKGSVCNRCGACLPRCPQGLAIPDHLLAVHRLLDSDARDDP
ncbi:MAG: aldo/keto reductase [Magnetococcales bacterium]|nr:aldo/keto reductase [Magnetococcales bacterium]